MKFSKYLLVTAMTATLGSTAIQATDGSITFNGAVTNSACTSIAIVTASTQGGCPRLVRSQSIPHN